MKGIYSFYWDCGRVGSVSGLFVAESADIAKAIGKQVYLGEVLGKHSEIYGSLDEPDVTLKSDAPADVEFFERLDLVTGYNPLEYINDDEEDDENVTTGEELDEQLDHGG